MGQFGANLSGRVVPSLAVLLSFGVALTSLADLAAALPGDVLLIVNEPEPMPGGIGIGVEYDGSRILYTHVGDNRIHFTDLSGADLGELSLTNWDGSPYTGDCCNAIAFNWMDRYLYGGGWGSTNLSRVDMRTGVVTMVKENAIPPQISFIDGLAWDPTTNTFWMSDDVSCFVEHLDISGNDIGGFDGCILTGYANSGLAVGLEGTLFYATASAGLIYALDTSSDPPTTLGVFSHTGGRDEDLSCGPRYTKSDNSVVTTLLSQDAYDNTFAIIEMAPGRCLTPDTPGYIDLFVSSADIWFVPPGPLPFGSVTSIEVTARNLGTQEARDVSIRFYDGPPPGANAIGSDQVVPSIAAYGGTGTASVPWTAGPPWAHEICVVVDPDDAILENDETNNQACATIEVLPPLLVTSLSIGQPNYTVAMTYVTSATPLTLTVLDLGGVGIQATKYWLDSGPWNVYASPFTLTGEGEHFVEWYSVDDLGNAEAVQWTYIRVDDTPPSTSLIVGDPKYLVGGTFVTSATPLSVVALDGGVTPVGIEATEYRVDGGPWLAYSAPFALAGDGLHGIALRSRDWLGNAELPVTAGIVVDDTPPITGISPSTGPFTPQTSFTLSATDAGSGVARSEYRIDGGAFLGYGAPFTVPPGSHRIFYRSDDHLENLEAERTLDVDVGSLPPVTLLIIGEPQWDAPPLYVTSATRLSLAATDRSSLGIRSTRYRVDSGTWANYTATGPFTLTGEAEHVLEWYSEDFAGNLEVVQSTVVRVDDTPPATTVEIGDPRYLVGGNFVKSTTPITLRAVDGGVLPVGLASLDVRIDGGSWTPSLGSFTVSGPDGPRRIEYAAADRLGNRETGFLDLFLDDAAPVTEISPADGPSSPDIVFTLAPTDPGSGVARTEYRIDGGAWLPYDGGFSISVGDHVIGYRSVDNLGNEERERTLDVRIRTVVSVNTNLKPFVAAVFAITLVVVGLRSARRAPWRGVATWKGRSQAFLATSLPFVAAEATTGIVSLFTGMLAIPPLLGLGMVVDVAILAAGLIIFILRARRTGGRRVRTSHDAAPVTALNL